MVQPDFPEQGLPLSPAEPVGARSAQDQSAYLVDCPDVVKAHSLDDLQLTPGLPPAEIGGRVPLIEGLEGDMHYFLSDPVVACSRKRRWSCPFRCPRSQ